MQRAIRRMIGFHAANHSSCKSRSESGVKGGNAYRRAVLLSVFLILALSPCAFAEAAGPVVTLPRMFTAGMILQRDVPTRVFGTATGSGLVSVSINHQVKQSAVVGGAWVVVLDAMPAGGTYSMTVSGSNTITVPGIDVGEVWLLGGQSNAAEPLNDSIYLDQVKQDVIPGIRFYFNDLGWLPVNGGDYPNQRYMYAQGYFFARKLYRDTGIAIGCMQGAYPGTDIGAWVDPKTQQEMSVTKVGWDHVGWCYERYIQPMVGYTIGGLLWNQGENDANAEDDKTWYTQLFKAMIRNWRTELFGNEFRLIVMQLPFNNDQYHAAQTQPVESNNGYAAMRQAQYEALAVGRAMVVPTIDLANGNIHPPNKDVTGERAAMAVHLLDGSVSLGKVGPIFDFQTIAGSELILNFRYARGLRFKNGASQLTGMAIAGADGVWNWADGRISGTQLILSSAAVPNPTQARYQWADNITFFGNVENVDGLPLHGFKSNSSVAVFPALISRQPDDQVVPAGQSVTFSVTATGSGPLTYLWQRGQAVVPGSQATLTLADVQSADAGWYTCTVINAFGSVKSLAARLTIQSNSNVPAAPSNLSAKVHSASQITLTWTDTSSNETSFKIEVLTTNGIFTQIAMVGAGVGTYVHGGLTPGTSYTYRVRSANASGDSGYSNESSATTWPSSTTHPTVVSPASGPLGRVTELTFAVSVMGGPLESESGLTYTWSVISGPSEGTVSFTPNDTNEAKHAMASVSQAGEWLIQVVITRTSDGMSVVSGPVTMTVEDSAAPPADVSDKGDRCGLGSGLAALFIAVLIRLGLVQRFVLPSRSINPQLKPRSPFLHDDFSPSGAGHV